MTITNFTMPDRIISKKLFKFHVETLYSALASGTLNRAEESGLLDEIVALYVEYVMSNTQVLEYGRYKAEQRLRWLFLKRHISQARHSRLQWELNIKHIVSYE